MTSNATVSTGRSPTALRVLPDPAENEEVLRYLSASRLKCWSGCRRQFYYRYVARIETPTAPALFLGQAVHELLRLYNWRRWKGESHDADQLRNELESWWTHEAPTANVAWKKPEDEGKARDQAWSLVETYLEQQPEAPNGKPERRLHGRS